MWLTGQSVFGRLDAHGLVMACVFCRPSSGTSCWEIKLFELISVLPLPPTLWAWEVRSPGTSALPPAKWRGQHEAPAEHRAKHFVTGIARTKDGQLLVSEVMGCEDIGAQKSSSVPWEGFKGRGAWGCDSTHGFSEVLGETALLAREQVLSALLLQQ